MPTPHTTDFKPHLAWYFEDPREPAIQQGTIYRFDGRAAIGLRGPHATLTVYQGLLRAASTRLWRVQISGRSKHHDGRMAGQTRLHIGVIDVAKTLLAFGKRCLDEAPNAHTHRKVPGHG